MPQFMGGPIGPFPIRVLALGDVWQPSLRDFVPAPPPPPPPPPPVSSKTLAALLYSRELVGGRYAGDDVPDRYWTGVASQDAAMNLETISGAI